MVTDIAVVMMVSTMVMMETGQEGQWDGGGSGKQLLVVMI